MSKDDTGAGTAAGAAGSVGWNLPMSGKTGTTEATVPPASSGSPTSYAAANYIYDDSTAPSELCSFPLRQCGGQSVRRQRTGPDVVRRDEADRHQLR